MVTSTAFFRQWSAKLQPVITRQFDWLLSYLEEINTPSRMVLFLLATVLCYSLLPGHRSQPVH